MSDTYWMECVGEALCEAGISATEEQLKTVAEIIQGAHEVYGEAHGNEPLGLPQDSEVKALRAELQKERAKVTCKACKGTGQIVTVYLPGRQSIETCDACRGRGRV